MLLRFLRFSILLFVFLVIGLASYAQTPPSIGPNAPPDPVQDPDTVPITGIEILIGAGALMGARRLRQQHKSKK